MELILSICLGIGLAAACGFRVFIPLFLASILSYFDIGTFGITDSFEWIGSLPALLTFGIASLVEVFAYYIPFVDNALDSIAVPLATISGTLITMSTMLELEPLVQWSIALIAGGGIAGMIKGSSAGTRLVSSGTTGGLANPIVSTAETSASIGISFLAWFFPFLGIAVVLIILFVLYRIIKRFRRKKAEP
ncbi:MAG: DUF4126 domain-containing protein [Bacteroidota bacterium]